MIASGCPSSLCHLLLLYIFSVHIPRAQRAQLQVRYFTEVWTHCCSDRPLLSDSKTCKKGQTFSRRTFGISLSEPSFACCEAMRHSVPLHSHDLFDRASCPAVGEALALRVTSSPHQHSYFEVTNRRRQVDTSPTSCACILTSLSSCFFWWTDSA